MNRLARLALAAATLSVVAIPVGLARAEDAPVVTAPPVVVSTPEDAPAFTAPPVIVTTPEVPPPTTEPAPWPVVMPNFPPPTTVPDTDDRCLPQGTTRLTVIFCAYVPSPTAVATAPAVRHTAAPVAHQPAATVRLSLLVLRWCLGVGGALGLR